MKVYSSCPMLHSGENAHAWENSKATITNKTRPDGSFSSSEPGWPPCRAGVLCVCLFSGSYLAGQEDSAPQSRQPEQPPPNIVIFNLIDKHFICRKTSKNTKIRSFSCRLHFKMNFNTILKRQCRKVLHFYTFTVHFLLRI
jgi:hypothetical protein